mmetsp:Transcript_12010/g.26216  ORF Transcript_12010/g.26216 Transcript_12010/m.26216 type:complete len:257 (-) Transcript_12010:585-1355(-)
MPRLDDSLFRAPPGGAIFVPVGVLPADPARSKGAVRSTRSSCTDPVRAGETHPRMNPTLRPPRGSVFAPRDRPRVNVGFSELPLGGNGTACCSSERGVLFPHMRGNPPAFAGACFESARPVDDSSVSLLFSDVLASPSASESPGRHPFFSRCAGGCWLFESGCFCSCAVDAVDCCAVADEASVVAAAAASAAAAGAFTSRERWNRRPNSPNPRVVRLVGVSSRAFPGVVALAAAAAGVFCSPCAAGGGTGGGKLAF